jgi:hypothetical protein
MIDYYLKFKDQAEAENVLSNLSFLTEIENEDEGVVLVSTGLASIDFVGVIHKTTGNMLEDIDGNEYPELAPLEGYHVNLRLASLPVTQSVDEVTGEVIEIPSPIPDLLAPYIVEPTTPSRVWA